MSGELAVELVVLVYEPCFAYETLPHLFFYGPLEGWGSMLTRPKITEDDARELSRHDPYPYDGWTTVRIAPPWVVLRPA